MRIPAKIRGWLSKDKIKAFLTAEEDALVVSWFDAAKVLAFVAFIFSCMGFFMDFAYIYVHDNTAGWYIDQDVQAMDKIYNFYKFLPVIAIIVVVFYLINYSNMKKGD